MRISYWSSDVCSSDLPCRIIDMSYGGNIAYSTQSSARPSRTQCEESCKWPTGPRMRSYRLGTLTRLRLHRTPSASRRPRNFQPMSLGRQASNPMLNRQQTEGDTTGKKKWEGGTV